MRVTMIELLGRRHPLCFSMTAAAEMDEAFGGLEKLAERIESGTLAQKANTVSRALEILLKAGRVYVSASGGELPEALPCSPADLIDVTDGTAVNAIFSAISGDMKREVEAVPKNGEAARGL